MSENNQKIQDFKYDIEKKLEDENGYETLDKHVDEKCRELRKVLEDIRDADERRKYEKILDGYASMEKLINQIYKEKQAS